MGQHVGNAVHVEPLEDLLHAVGDLVDVLAELGQVLAVDGRDERLGQGGGHLVLFLVGGVLHGVHLFQHHADGVGFVVGQAFHQVLRQDSSAAAMKFSK